MTCNVRNNLINACNFTLTPCRIAIKGVKTQNNSLSEKIKNVSIKIICGSFVIITFPITLTALTIKWILTPAQANSKQKKQDNQPAKINEEQAPLEPNSFEERLNRDMLLSQQTDLKLNAPKDGSWRKSYNHIEYYQTLTRFLEDYRDRPSEALDLFKIGEFTETDLKILSITRDYLHHFHQVETNDHDEPLKFDEMKAKYKESWDQFLAKEPENEQKQQVHNYYISELDRSSRVKFGHDQYNADLILSMMDKNLRPEVDTEDHHPPIIAFTNEDLYARDMNFVFGLGSYSGTGVFSKARFGNPEESPKQFEKTLIRMMKIAAHEFGHMRGLPHCTDYECNIGGYMSLDELDARPLLYCSEDTAKICFASKISLSDYYQNLLQYFENFNAKYQLNCDFSKEINTLRERISVLN